MRAPDRARSLALLALALAFAGLSNGCTQKGDPVVTVMLAMDSGSGGATGQVMQQPVDAGPAAAPPCEYPPLYNVFSGVLGNDCKIPREDPLNQYVNSIRNFASSNPSPPCPECRPSSPCDANGSPFGIYPDPDGKGGSILCPAACDSVRAAVRQWSADFQKCMERRAAGAAPSPAPAQ